MSELVSEVPDTTATTKTTATRSRDEPSPGALPGAAEPIRVSLVIPIRDEAENLPELLDRLAELQKVLDGRGMASEVLFVDDGSHDGGAELVIAARAKHPRLRLIELRRGYGKAAALAAGFDRVHGDLVVTLDGDLQDDPLDVPKLLEKIESGADVVVGWRRVRHDPLGKRVPSAVFNWMLRRATRLAIHDVNCGLKAFRKEAAEALDLYGDQHRLIPLIAHGHGFRVTEVEVRHAPRRGGRTKYGAGRFARGIIDLLTVIFLLRFDARPAHFFGGTGLALFAGGVAVLTYITYLRIATGHIQNRYPLLALGVLLLVVGFQLLTTGFLAELIVLATRAGARGRSSQEKYVVRREVG